MKNLLLKFSSYLLLAVSVLSCHVETPDPAIVNFSGVADKGKVSFVNNTTGADSYVWDFDDGQKSTDKDPVHTYTSIRDRTMYDSWRPTRPGARAKPYPLW